MLLLVGVTSNAEHLVAGFLATMGFRGWTLDVSCFPFDLLYLSFVVAGARFNWQWQVGLLRS